MRCKHCGNDIPEGSKFCIMCGAKIEPEEQKAESEKRAAFRQPDKPLKQAEKAAGKRSLKLPLILAAAVLVIAALLLIIKPWKGSSSQTARAYKAYNDILSEKADDLAAYDWQLNLAGSENGTESRPVLFRDICGNEIPELILVRASDKEKRTAMLEIYTFEKGKAKLLFSQEWNLGLKYILYQNKIGRASCRERV